MNYCEMNLNVLELSEQEIIRRNSLNELRAMGIEPYPAAEYVTNAFSNGIKSEFKDDAEPREVSIAGRIMSRRVMGKASFIELQDSKGRIQVYITRDDICPRSSNYKTRRDASRCISPAMTSAPTKTKICTMLSSNVCSTWATL